MLKIMGSIWNHDGDHQMLVTSTKFLEYPKPRLIYMSLFLFGVSDFTNPTPPTSWISAFHQNVPLVHFVKKLYE